MKTAVITFDEKRVEDWDLDAEANSIAWILHCALNGRDYARERGIESIEIVEPLITLPNTYDVLGMTKLT